MAKHEFGEGPIFTITNYIYWFLMGNLYFSLLNIPAIFIISILLHNEINTLPKWFYLIIFICFLSIGPSVTALLSVMGKLFKEKDIDITKDFFTAYKTSFSQALLLWTLELLLIFILVIDAKYFINQHFPYIFVILMYIFIAFIFMIGMYVFPILSRFYINSKDIIKLATYYTIKKFHITILNLLCFAILGFIFFKISIFIIIFISSIICFLIMIYEHKILLEIEDRLKDINKS